MATLFIITYNQLLMYQMNSFAESGVFFNVVSVKSIFKVYLFSDE